MAHGGSRFDLTGSIADLRYLDDLDFRMHADQPRMQIVRFMQPASAPRHASAVWLVKHGSPVQDKELTRTNAMGTAPICIFITLFGGVRRRPHGPRVGGLFSMRYAMRATQRATPCRAPR